MHMDGNKLGVHIKDAKKDAARLPPFRVRPAVGTYIGQLISLEPTQTLYTDRAPEYPFDVRNGCYLDAQVRLG